MEKVRGKEGKKQNTHLTSPSPPPSVCTAWHTAQYIPMVTKPSVSKAYKFAYAGSPKVTSFPSCPCQAQPQGTADAQYPNKDAESDIVSEGGAYIPYTVTQFRVGMYGIGCHTHWILI